MLIDMTPARVNRLHWLTEFHRPHVPEGLLTYSESFFKCWIRKKYSFLKVYSISPNSRVFPRNQPFSAVFAILNIRNRLRSILFFMSIDNIAVMILQKKKWKKVKNWSFGGFFKFEIFNFWWIFLIFSYKFPFFSQNMLLLLPA